MGDEWLSHNSLEFIGVFSSVDKAVDVMITKSNGEDMVELQSMIHELRIYGQTNNHCVNWIIEECNIDE